MTVQSECKHWCLEEEWTTNDNGETVYPCLKCGKEMLDY